MHNNPGLLRTTKLGSLLLLLVALTTGCHRDPNKQKQKYLESGKRYAAEGKYKEAAIQFSNALKVDHNFAEAHLELGTTYLKMGSVMPGYSELSRAVALRPDNVKARIELGDLLLAGRQPARAEEQAKAILAAKPDSADGYALLSSIAASRGDKAEALAQIQHALTLDPNRAAFHTALGMIQGSDDKNPAEAEDQLRKAVTLDTHNVTSHLALAAMLEHKGDLAGALEQDKAAVAADPKSLMARSSLGELYTRKGDSANAEATLRQATEDLVDTPGGAQLLQNYYLRTNQIDRAAQVYGELSHKYPKNVPIKLSYARFLVAKRDLPSARTVIAELEKSDANDPDVAVLNGMLLLNDDKASEALGLLQKASKNNPDNVPLHLWLARAAMQQGDYAGAQQSFADAARLSPQNVDARDGLAQVAMQRHDSNLLAQVAEAGIAASPQNSVGYVWRGMAEAGQQQQDKAEADFRQALKLDPKNWGAMLELAQLKLSEKKTAEARPLLEEALAINSSSSRATGLLVSTYLMEKQPQKGLSLLQAQIAKSPQNGEMYVQLSEVQMQLGDVNGALDSAQKAVQLSPRNEQAVVAVTRAQLAHGEPVKAIDSWQNWLKTHSQDAQAYAILGTLQQQQGDKDKAIESYKKALSLQPEQPVAANNLAYLMIDGGQNADVALSYAQTARRILPNSPSTADTLAWVYYAKGTYTSARDLLEEAAKQAPEDASIQYHLGMTYRKLADSSNAELHLKKAVALSPDSQSGKDAQKALTQQS